MFIARRKEEKEMLGETMYRIIFLKETGGRKVRKGEQSWGL